MIRPTKRPAVGERRGSRRRRTPREYNGGLGLTNLGLIQIGTNHSLMWQSSQTTPKPERNIFLIFGCAETAQMPQGESPPPGEGGGNEAAACEMPTLLRTRV